LAFKFTPNDKFYLIILEFDKVMLYYVRLLLTQRNFHFHDAFFTKHKLLTFDNKQIVKMHKFLGYFWTLVHPPHPTGHIVPRSNTIRVC